jgi:hypothetical protein
MGDDTDAYLKRVKTMTEPARQPGQRLWHSPHGTEWKANTYEEALEAERDHLAAELTARERQLASLREAAQKVLDMELGIVPTAARILEKALAAASETP